MLSGQGFVVSVTVFARFWAEVEVARRVARAAERVKDFILKIANDMFLEERK